MNGLVCLCGRLLSPTKLLTNEGEYDIAPETFYKIGVIHIFLVNTRTYPWRIWRAVKLKC